MLKLIEIASSVSTPLGLGGLFAAVLFFVLKQLLEQGLIPAVARSHSADLIKLIIERLFTLALVAMVLGFVGYVVTSLMPSLSQPVVPAGAASTKAPPPPTEARVVVCSGTVCQAGDWPVGKAFPTGYGDCSVHLRVENLDTNHAVDQIAVQGIQAIVGNVEPTTFTITKVELHPNAYTNAAVRKNLYVCGHVIDTQDRRAVVRLLVTYKQ